MMPQPQASAPGAGPRARGSTLPHPHGGRLVDLRVKDEEERRYLLGKAKELPRIALDEGQAADLGNLADGSYSPLRGFLSRHDFLKVVHDMTLEDGTVWPMPIVLPLSREEAERLRGEREVALVDRGGRPLAVMELEEVYPYDREATARELFGTSDPAHPGVREWLAQGEFLAGGEVRLIRELQVPPQFERYRLHPVETRVLFTTKGWRTVVGFQTRNIPHRGHEYIQKSALEIADGLLIHPKIGRKKPGDFKDALILRAYQALIDNYYLKDRAVLAIFPARMRYMGPREAVFDALVRKNYGCTHFIVGRDHAGVGRFYEPEAAQRIFEELDELDLGIIPLRFEPVFYCKRCQGMVSEKTCPHPPKERINPSGTLLRELFARGELPPSELVRPEVARIILEEEAPFA